MDSNLLSNFGVQPIKIEHLIQKIVTNFFIQTSPLVPLSRYSSLSLSYFPQSQSKRLLFFSLIFPDPSIWFQPKPGLNIYVIIILITILRLSHFSQNFRPAPHLPRSWLWLPHSNPPLINSSSSTSMAILLLLPLSSQESPPSFSWPGTIRNENPL